MKFFTQPCFAFLMSVAIGQAASAQDTAQRLETSQDAVNFVFESKALRDGDRTRLVEFFDRNVNGSRTWTMTFFSDEETLTIKFDEDAKVEIRDLSGVSSLYNPAFHDRVPRMQDDINAAERLQQARMHLQEVHPDAKIEDDYIVQFRFCFPPKAGEASDHANGCRKDEPLQIWKVWLKMQPSDGDWVVKEVLIADAQAPVVKDGPRGFFE